MPKKRELQVLESTAVDGSGRIDIRHRKAVELRLKGKTVKQTAKHLSVSEETIYNWFRKPVIAEMYLRYKDMMLEDAESRLRLEWSSLMDNLIDIGKGTEDKRVAVQAIKEARLTLGRGNKVDLEVDIKSSSLDSFREFLGTLVSLPTPVKGEPFDEANVSILDCDGDEDKCLQTQGSETLPSTPSDFGELDQEADEK